MTTILTLAWMIPLAIGVLSIGGGVEYLIWSRFRSLP